MGIRTEIKDAISEDRLYGFVCNNQHRLSKDELVELFKECDYAAYTLMSTSERESYCKTVKENLIEDGFFEE